MNTPGLIEQQPAWHETHGRKGQAQEYYEFALRAPRFVAQRCGDYWIVGSVEPGPKGPWHIEAQTYPTAQAAREAARALAERYYSLAAQHYGDNPRLFVTANDLEERLRQIQDGHLLQLSVDTQ